MGAALAAGLGVALGGAAAAQDFPQRDAKLVVTTAAGGAADRVARMVASGLEAKWRRAVVVENRVGASGIIGVDHVAKSPADGHTMLFASGTFIQVPAALPSAPYQPLREFAAVSQICTLGIVFVVNAASPTRTLQDFLKPGQAPGAKPLSYASIGIGSSGHLYGEILSRDTKTAMVNVPFPGEAPGLTAVAGGHVDANFASIASSMPMIKGDKIRPLAVVGRERSALLPDVPTMTELGVPRLDLVTWYGILVPAGTAKAIVDRISADIAAVAQEPTFAKAMADMGFEAKGTTAEEYAAVIRRDYESLKALIEETGVRPQQ